MPLPPTLLDWVLERTRPFLFPEPSPWESQAEGILLLRGHEAERPCLEARLEWDHDIAGSEPSLKLSFLWRSYSVAYHAWVDHERRSLSHRLELLNSRLPSLLSLLFPRQDGTVAWSRSPLFALARQAATEDLYWRLGNIPCGLACSFCTRSLVPWREPSAALMSEQLYEFARTLPLGAGHRLSIGGDEPLHHTDLDSFITLAVRLGWRVTLFTSAARELDSARLGALKEAGLEAFEAPLYGATAATHDAVVGVEGHFDATSRFFDAALRQGFRLWVHSVVTARNAQEMDALFERAEREPWEAFGVMLPRDEGPARLPYAEVLPRLGELSPRLRFLLKLALPCLGDAPPPFQIATAEWAPVCASCRARKRCSGLPPGYLAVHGAAEFRAQ